MTTTTELTPLLRTNTLPERVALARREQLDYELIPPSPRHLLIRSSRQ